MIKFRLQCRNGHVVDSWFSSSADYDRLKSAGHLTCDICGSPEVEKTLMTPQVAPESTDVVPAEDPATRRKVAKALAEMQREVEAKSDWVGDKFAQEARAIHEGDAPERSIYGQAKPDEARALIEDGVPVAPLPFRPKKIAN